MKKQDTTQAQELPFRINRGFVITYRDELDMPVFMGKSGDKILKVWLWLKSHAAHEDTTINGIQVKRGEVLTFLSTIATECEVLLTNGMPDKKKISRIIDKLEVPRLLSRLLPQDLPRQYIHLIICNYDIYNGAKNENATANATVNATANATIKKNIQNNIEEELKEESISDSNDICDNHEKNNLFSRIAGIFFGDYHKHKIEDINIFFHEHEDYRKKLEPYDRRWIYCLSQWFESAGVRLDIEQLITFKSGDAVNIVYHLQNKGYTEEQSISAMSCALCIIPSFCNIEEVCNLHGWIEAEAEKHLQKQRKPTFKIDVPQAKDNTEVSSYTLKDILEDYDPDKELPF